MRFCFGGNMKVVNILGAKYKVYTDVPVSKDDSLINRFGYSAPIEHKIVIADLNTIDGWKDETDAVKQKQNQATLRHEVIHCFIYESGLWGSSCGIDAWALNEEMVDWIAIQFPKILKIYQELGCTGVE
jgi:hypothetical protein